jgi:hypothetical protein
MLRTGTHRAHCSPWPLKTPLAALHQKIWTTRHSYQVSSCTWTLLQLKTAPPDDGKAIALPGQAGLVATERKCWVEIPRVDRRRREEPSPSHSLHRNELGAQGRLAVREHRGAVVHIPIPPPCEGLRGDQQSQLATRQSHNNTSVMWNAGHVGGCDVHE